MNKKAYIIPAIEIEEMELTPLMEASVTSVGGDAGIELGDGEAPGSADSRIFEFEWD